jgi:hypothetical protein
VELQRSSFQQQLSHTGQSLISSTPTGIGIECKSVALNSLPHDSQVISIFNVSVKTRLTGSLYLKVSRLVARDQVEIFNLALR